MRIIAMFDIPDEDADPDAVCFDQLSIDVSEAKGPDWFLVSWWN